MAILAFQKPDKVIMLESSPKFGKFEFRPLEPGFGTTVGNALRRILLSSLEGYAINTIKIEMPIKILNAITPFFFFAFVIHPCSFLSFLQTVFHIFLNITQKTGYAIITPNAKK